MGKTPHIVLVLIALLLAIISVQGQTDQTDYEIHEYDITVNSLNNGKYSIGLKNNLLLSELDVLFDEIPVGSIPRGPTWKEFEVDELPASVKVSGEGRNYKRNLMEYVPWAYQDNNYNVIDKLILDENGAEIGLKVKIEYPSSLAKNEKGILDIKEITKDSKYATSPDSQNNIQTFSIIKIASDESIREEPDYLGTSKIMLLDPIIIANGPVELLKPYNGWMIYDDNLRGHVKELYPKAIADASIAEGIERLIDMVTLGDVRKACEIALEGIFEGLDFKEVCNALAKWQKEYTIGEPPSEIFSNENDYDCFTYIFGVNGYEDLCTGANGVWLKWPFSFDTDEDHEIRLHFDTMFEGDIPSLGVKGGRIGKEYSLSLPMPSEEPDEKEIVSIFEDDFSSNKEWICSPPSDIVRDSEENNMKWHVDRSYDQRMYHSIDPIDGDFSLKFDSMISDATNNCDIKIGLIDDINNVLSSSGLMLQIGYYGGGTPYEHWYACVLGRYNDGAGFTSTTGEVVPSTDTWSGYVPISPNEWYSYELDKVGSHWSLTVQDANGNPVGRLSGELTGDFSSFNYAYIGNWDTQDWPSANGRLDNIKITAYKPLSKRLAN